MPSRPWLRIFTFLRFFSAESGHNPFSEVPNQTGKTFAQYIHAQKECCAYQGINEYNAWEYYLEDLLHMNEDGYRKIAPVQAAFLANGF